MLTWDLTARLQTGLAGFQYSVVNYFCVPSFQTEISVNMM